MNLEKIAFKAVICPAKTMYMSDGRLTTESIIVNDSLTRKPIVKSNK